MAGRGSKNHIHKYRRISLASQRVYACALPDCTHYMPKHMEQMLMGKTSICWECDSEFVLDYEALKSDNPVCLNCRRGASNEDILELLRHAKGVQ